MLDKIFGAEKEEYTSTPVGNHGQDIYNMILGDNMLGVPPLPVFMGNFLLDLLSSFFPIFILLASFVIVYQGFTKGMGDWKQTASILAPSAVSIMIILGILSMKTPYTSNGNNNGNFWQDTNSYTVVEMMTMFLGFGGTFADALTHKMLYGTLDVSASSKSDFDGYFPNMLQSMADNNKSQIAEHKNLLDSSKTEEEYLNEVGQFEQEIALDLKRFLNHLADVSIIDNVHSIDLNEIRSKVFVSQATDKETRDKATLFVRSDDLSKTINLTGNDLTKGAHDFDMSMFNKVEKDETNQNPRLIDIFKPSSSLSLTSNVGRNELIMNILNPHQYDIELGILELTRKFMRLKIVEVEFYDRKIKELEIIKSRSEVGTKLSFIEKLIATNVKKKEIAKFMLEKTTKLEKDLGLMLKNLYDYPYNDYFGKQADAIFFNGFYESIKRYSYLSEDFEKDIAKHILNIKQTRVPIINIEGSAIAEFKEHDYRINMLNNIFGSKAYIVNSIMINFYDIVKQDALARPAEKNSRSIFALATLENNAIAELDKADKRRNELLKKYTDKTTGQINVNDELQQVINQNYKELGSNVIYWTDLGKHYGVFKNLYSPMMTNAIGVQEMNKVDSARNESMREFIEDLEPAARNTRVLQAGLAVGTYEAVKGAAKVAVDVTPIGKGASKLKSLTDKSSSSALADFWNAIKTVGGVTLGIFFVNVFLPALVWMFAMITYYIEMSIYVVVFPVAFMFMIFQSYRQSLVQYINTLIGLILYPIVLVSIFFIVLYIDMLIPMFFNHYLPFFKGYDEFTSAFDMGVGDTGIATTITSASGGAFMSVAGTFIYTILNFAMSSLLILTWLRAHEYMGKILNVSMLGQDTFSGRDTVNKFSSFEGIKDSAKLSRV